MIRAFVINRLRIQRGQAFIAMVTQVLIAVGVWRNAFPSTPWWVLTLFGGAVYLIGAWGLGLLDEKTHMFRYEQERMTQMNPQVNRILEIVERMEGSLDEEKASETFWCFGEDYGRLPENDTRPPR